MDASVIYAGLVHGAVLALVGLGFTMIYATTHILNFAQGEYLMVGALLAYTVQAQWGQSFIVALLVVIPVLAVLGMITERLVVLPVQMSGSHYAWIIATIATALLISNLMVYPYGRDAVRVPPAFEGTAFTLSGVKQSWQTVLVLVATVLILSAYEFFLRRTAYGKAIRATAESTDVSELMGINTKNVIRVSFMFSAVVTGIAGVLVGPITFADTSMGFIWTIPAFIAVILGGMGSAAGAVTGGILIGLLTSIFSVWLLPGWTQVAVYSLLAVMLLFRPTGIFAREAGH